MMIEALSHESASFVTLTYEDERLPDAGEVVPDHLQRWLKRVRKNIGPCRFYAVGEYGDYSERPHYHVALFGLGPEFADGYQITWRDGYTYTGDLTIASAAYIAGYVTKKMTSKDDARLGGRHPEFARMSLRPGIGALGIGSVAEALSNKVGWNEVTRIGDVPNVLQHGGAKMPFGRYLKRRLRGAMNFEELGEQDEVRATRNAEVLVMYRDYICAQKEKGEAALGLQHMLITESAQRVLNLEARMRVKWSRKGVGI